MKPNWLDTAYKLWESRVPNKYYYDRREKLFSFYTTLAIATATGKPDDVEVNKLARYRQERYRLAIRKRAKINADKILAEKKLSGW